MFFFGFFYNFREFKATCKEKVFYRSGSPRVLDSSPVAPAVPGGAQMALVVGLVSVAEVGVPGCAC